VLDGFESPTGIGEMIAGMTGEAELATVRLADWRNFSQYYDFLSSGDLEIALGDLLAFGSRGIGSDWSRYGLGRTLQGRC
jgi:hypothetical protein